MHAIAGARRRAHGKDEGHRQEEATRSLRQAA
jgi:hypothetical protein